MCIVAPGCAEITDAVLAQLAPADVLFFDGTLFHDREMIDAGLGWKTGQRMGHVSVSGPNGALVRLEYQIRDGRILRRRQDAGGPGGKDDLLYAFPPIALRTGAPGPGWAAPSSASTRSASEPSPAPAALPAGDSRRSSRERR